MDDTILSLLLGELKGVRTEVSNLGIQLKIDLRDVQSDMQSNLKDHTVLDETQFEKIAREVQLLRDSQNRARGFIFACMALQGVIVTVLAIVQLIHLTSGVR